MDNRAKIALSLAAAVLCIGSAGALVHVFSGSWKEMEGVTTKAGVAPWLRNEKPEPPAAVQESAPVQYAYISGAVEKPGVYPITANFRVFQLVEAAGGLRPDADDQNVNLAAPVKDGAHVHIKPLPGSSEQKRASKDSSPAHGKKSGAETEYVYVNTADEASLVLLPGIGPALAKKIIQYRQAHGPFQSPEGLTAVDGIGKEKLKKIENLLRF